MSSSLTNSLPSLKYDWGGCRVNNFTLYASENGGNYPRNTSDAIMGASGRAVFGAFSALSKSALIVDKFEVRHLVVVKVISDDSNGILTIHRITRIERKTFFAPGEHIIT